MIKASELRIGNYIYRKNKLTNKENIIKLTASDILDISANREFSIFVYEPIPLSDETLLNGGFEKVEDYFIVGKRCLYFDNDDFVWYLNTDKGLYYCNNIDSVYYIHELQNVYYFSSKDDYMFEREELQINL